MTTGNPDVDNSSNCQAASDLAICGRFGDSWGVHHGEPALESGSLAGSLLASLRSK